MYILLLNKKNFKLNYFISTFKLRIILLKYLIKLNFYFYLSKYTYKKIYFILFFTISIFYLS